MSKTEKPQIDKFKPQRVNANKHNPRGMKALDDSILQDGWIGAITTAADGETFDGSARLETLQQGEGADPIVVEIDGTRPVILKRLDIANADDPKAQRLAIAANRVAELNLDWDADVLAELSQEINLTGLWSDEELSNLLASQESGEGSGEEDEEEVSDLIDEAESGAIESRVSLGQIWKLGRHTLCCGDSTNESNVKKLLGDRKIDMVFTDPPYNIDYQGVSDKREKIKNDKMSDDLFFEFLCKSIQKADAMYVCCSWQYSHLFRQAMDQLGCKPKAMIVWDKVNPAQHLDLYFKQHELIWYFGDFGGQHTVRGDVWQIKRQKNIFHPTTKPVELIQMALGDHPSKKLIYDGFLGSGSTLIAAQQMEGTRSVVGFELSEEYCEVICRRFESLTGINAELVGSLTNG